MRMRKYLKKKKRNMAKREKEEQLKKNFEGRMTRGTTPFITFCNTKVGHKQKSVA